MKLLIGAILLGIVALGLWHQSRSTEPTLKGQGGGSTDQPTDQRKR